MVTFLHDEAEIEINIAIKMPVNVILYIYTGLIFNTDNRMVDLRNYEILINYSSRVLFSLFLLITFVSFLCIFPFHKKFPESEKNSIDPGPLYIVSHLVITAKGIPFGYIFIYRKYFGL